MKPQDLVARNDPAEVAAVVAAVTSAAVSFEKLLEPAAAELEKLAAGMLRLEELGENEEIVALAPIVLAVRESARGLSR